MGNDRRQGKLWSLQEGAHQGRGRWLCRSERHAFRLKW